MKIETRFLGTKEIDESKTVIFTEGLCGFADIKKYVLFPQPETPFLFLQSIEKKDLCFILINPYVIKPDYAPELLPEVRESLELDDEEQPAIYTTIVIENDIDHMRTNLQAPIVINVAKKKARQVVLTKGNYPVKFPLPSRKREGDPQC